MSTLEPSRLVRDLEYVHILRQVLALFNISRSTTA